jgi:dTDP-4-amino-4,6-dideoxygalactose transaminase
MEPLHRPQSFLALRVVEAGYKYNLPDVLAAIGREQLKRAESMRDARLALARRYDEAFASDDRFLLPPTDRGTPGISIPSGSGKPLTGRATP